jgi:hypothetical protein
MFVQFIEGPVHDGAALRRQLDQWLERCGDGADGWLGTTAGVTTDGTGFVAARFASADAARANSDRDEQSAWWAETEKVFDGTIAFTDCDDVRLVRGGGSDDAGFVQVIRGRVRDEEAARAWLGEEDLAEGARPDVIGGLIGLHPAPAAYTMVVYFTSEAEARAGEAEETAAGGDDPVAALHAEPPRYLDLPEPWLWSP